MASWQCQRDASSFGQPSPANVNVSREKTREIVAGGTRGALDCGEGAKLGTRSGQLDTIPVTWPECHLSVFGGV